MPEMPESHRFVLTPADLFCQDAHTAGPENSIRREELLEYDVRIHGSAGDSIIFWGPYIPLYPGVYLFSFHGKLDGELYVDFSHTSGEAVLKAERMKSFDKPLCLALTRPVERFEVRAHRTPELKLMRLEGIAIDYIPVKQDDS